MSLFDVIRYPITDFTCQDEMMPIPANIIHPWADDCLSFLGMTDIEDLNDHTSYAVGLIVYKYILVASKEKYDTIDQNFVDICRYYFLMMLKARIRDA